MKKNKKILSILTISLFLLIGVIGTTLCALASSDTVTNKFNTGDNKIEIVEDFKEPNKWDGDKYTKKVKFKNTTNDSNTPVLIRVSIVPRWEDENGQTCANLSVNVVELETSNIVTDKKSDNTWQSKKWFDGNDGYYYYTSLLQPYKSDKDYTSEILKSVSLNIPENEKSKYEGKTLKVDVNAESVQVNKEAYRQNWNIKENSKIDELLSSLVK